MTSLRFIPIFEEQNFFEAVEEYTNIWDTEGAAILDAFKNVTGLELKEDKIAVIIYEGISFSGRGKKDVMKLRASYEIDVKKATLIHELGHRLMFGRTFESSAEEHHVLYLFLYDVWHKLYGKDFADRMVEIESERSDMYKNAWAQALSLSFNQRQEQLLEKLVTLKY